MRSGRQIDLDLADTKFVDELAALVGSWKACFNCGCCAATCPSGVGVYQLNLTGFPNLSGLKELSTLQELTTLKSCILCGKCVLVCPRGVSTRYLVIQYMNKLREYAEAV